MITNKSLRASMAAELLTTGGTQVLLRADQTDSAYGKDKAAYGKRPGQGSRGL